MLIAAWGANLIANQIDKKSFYEKTAEIIANDLLDDLKSEKKAVKEKELKESELPEIKS